jgi:multidrug efflux pump subunit AcrB
MQFFGLTINLATLFALVLAIGIVVDDAIVVVEAVQAKMKEKGVSPYKAVFEVLGEDQGILYEIIQIPPGSTLEQTNKVAVAIKNIAKNIPGVRSVSSLAAYEIIVQVRGSNAGTCLICQSETILL